MLLDVLGHVEQALQVPQRIVRLALVELAVELTLAGAVSAALVHRNLLRARIAGWLGAFIMTYAGQKKMRLSW